MRHLQRRAERHDVAGQKAKAVVFAAFVILFKQRLHTQAHAYEKFARPDLLFQHGNELEFLQIRHGVANGPDAGKLDEIGLPDDRRVAGNVDGHAQTLPGVVHVGQIANFIIDNSYLHATAPPS